MKINDITSEFSKEIFDKIDRRELFEDDLKALLQEGFIADSKLVKNLIKYCQKLKHSDCLNVWSILRESHIASELCDLLNEMMSDYEMYNLRKNLESRIYG